MSVIKLKCKAMVFYTFIQAFYTLVLEETKLPVEANNLKIILSKTIIKLLPKQITKKES